MPTTTTPPPPDTTAITRSGPSSVTYHIPHTPPASPKSPYKTTIHLPPSSTWSSNLHWHETHTEYLCLKRGAIYVELDDEVYILSASHGGVFSTHDKTAPSRSSTVPASSKIQNGVVTVERGVRHCWHRASHYYSTNPSSTSDLPEDIDDEVVVEEWTDPVDVMKALFFFNLNAVISAPASGTLPLSAKVARLVLGSWWVDFQLFVIFRELDNWPVFWGGGRWREWVVTHLVLFLASALGRLVGVRAVTEGRTPRKLWNVWQRRQDGKKND